MKLGKVLKNKVLTEGVNARMVDIYRKEDDYLEYLQDNGDIDTEKDWKLAEDSLHKGRDFRLSTGLQFRCVEKDNMKNIFVYQWKAGSAQGMTIWCEHGVIELQ